MYTFYMFVTKAILFNFEEMYWRYCWKIEKIRISKDEYSILEQS